MQVSKIALRIATEAKSIGDKNLIDTIVDAGFHEVTRQPGDCNGLVSEAFDALVEEVEGAMPFARHDRRIAAEWVRAGMDMRADMMAERRALSSHW